LSLALNVVAKVSKSSFSSYTYDSLFTSDASGFAITGFEALFGLCVEFGDYCSRCISVFGKCVTCLERTKSYCCFNSHLARIINEQGRAQVGKTWGSDTARNPDCSGFSVAQLQSLDFSRMDLSELYAEITPTILNPGAAARNAAARVPACYFGKRQC